MKKKIFISVLAVVFCVMCSGCYQPSPLYGKWSDNNGNSINFMNDLSFIANISMNNKSYSYEGTWQALDNVLAFSVSSVTVDKEEPKNVSKSIVSEWDLHGSMLYISWTESEVTKNLVLYHVSK